MVNQISEGNKSYKFLLLPLTNENNSPFEQNTDCPGDKVTVLAETHDKKNDGADKNSVNQNVPLIK